MADEKRPSARMLELGEMAYRAFRQKDHEQNPDDDPLQSWEYVTDEAKARWAETALVSFNMGVHAEKAMAAMRKGEPPPEPPDPTGLGWRKRALVAESAEEEYRRRIKATLEVISNYGGIDGGHHKAWVLDQAVRKLAGTEEIYQRWVREQWFRDLTAAATQLEDRLAEPIDMGEDWPPA